MIPLVGHVKELQDQKAIVTRIAEQVMAEQKIKIKYLVGTMIEVPRGALTAGEIATEAEFFSFGTNDLTQMAFGYRVTMSASSCASIRTRRSSRDPFATIDTQGVGGLVALAVERGRQARPTLKLGICGEHGGDAASIHFAGIGQARLRQRVSVSDSGRTSGVRRPPWP